MIGSLDLFTDLDLFKQNELICFQIICSLHSLEKEFLGAENIPANIAIVGWPDGLTWSYPQKCVYFSLWIKHSHFACLEAGYSTKQLHVTLLLITTCLPRDHHHVKLHWKQISVKIHHKYFFFKPGGNTGLEWAQLWGERWQVIGSLFIGIQFTGFLFFKFKDISRTFTPWEDDPHCERPTYSSSSTNSWSRACLSDV